MKLSVIVPAYNEEATILQILEKVQNTRLEGVSLEVIVIDDGSKDSTPALLKANPHLYAQLVCCEKNGGKGAAVKRGLELATGDYVLFQDADLEYDPKEYQTLIEPARDYGADVVIGSRFLAPTHVRVHYFWHKIGNLLLTLTFNMLYNTTFTDIYTCYLLFRRTLVDPTKLKTVGWEQQAEILGTCVRRGTAFYEVAISYYGRSYSEGKKIRAHHALAILWTIVRQRFVSTR
jgi:glycosyltransferase involved in cell wall biosynthesis